MLVKEAMGSTWVQVHLVGRSGVVERGFDGSALLGRNHLVSAPKQGRHGMRRSAELSAETIWWTCALDEQLNGGSTRPDTDYARARDADPMGRYVRALRWLRNRHTH